MAPTLDIPWKGAEVASELGGRDAATKATWTAEAPHRLAAREALAQATESHALSISGKDLTVGDVVSVASNPRTVLLADSTTEMEESVQLLRAKLQHHEILYGINTGFGGSADVRTTDTKGLQSSLIKLLNVGVLSIDAPAAPSAYVAAAMVCRLNSSCRGHSAIRKSVLDHMAEMVTRRLLPVVPLRGSISASGDLVPFSYIASAMAGLSTSLIERPSSPASRPGRSAHVLREHGLEPVQFQEKEVLALLNGTHFSVASASLAVFEANQLSVATQVLTALTVEALGGSLESFDDFISRVRPHPGQAECAANIRRLLQGSGMVAEASGKDYTSGLRQDRYATRTAPQWIGPQLEALRHATETITIELNSTTDNPLFDVTEARAVHGGNFQAMAVTNAMESTRLALCHLGKLIFAQHTELVNVKSNNGLSPNLCWNEPSTDFGFKGVEISMASYMSELAYLAGPVSTHVQAAELGNQAVNSLAFLSARYTAEACRVLKLMVAAHLYALYQAMQLRQRLDSFLDQLPALVTTAFHQNVNHACVSTPSPAAMQRITSAVATAFTSNATLDGRDRCAKAAAQATALFLDSDVIELDQEVSAVSLSEQINRFKGSAAELMAVRWHELSSSPAVTRLSSRGPGRTIEVLRYIEDELSVPPWLNDDDCMLGDRIGQLHDALNPRSLYSVFHRCF